MKKYCLAFLGFAMLLSCDLEKYRLVNDFDFVTRFEATGGKETGTYQEVIRFYRELDKAHETINLQEIGKTDSGEPLHLAIFSKNRNFDLEKLREDHIILLINNGIHPGESDGIDATMMLFRDLAGDSIGPPKHTIIATIPVYNVGGALNRNTSTRTNQHGPEEYGFRGNARNYDLNRDFIKGDSRNARSFYKIYHMLQPDVFLDTHVSNGADYQYTLTHLFTQPDKLGGELGDYLRTRMVPAIEDSLRKKDWEITPYVNVFNEVPEKGFEQFLDHPRYSTGYTSLFNSLGLMLETHMLKPYPKRVQGTYEFMRSLIGFTDAQKEIIRDLRERERRKYLTERWYPLHFEADRENPSRREFKGYRADRIPSVVTGQQRLKYHREQAFTQEIDYYDHFVPRERVEIPRAYIIPQGWWNVTELLKLNQIKMEPLKNDTIIAVETYRIEGLETADTPFEGHFLHRNTRISVRQDSIRFRKGDLYIRTFQDGVRYLVETLEPTAPDSFFNWNFFDPILQQKEGFSAYVFEEKAAALLEEDPALREAFEAKKRREPDFSENGQAQLDWLHKQSEHYETSHLRYPVYRVPR